jgi:hypothetical protein
MDDSLFSLFLVAAFAGGFFLGGLTVLASSSSSPDPVLSYDKSGLYDRGLSVNLPEAGTAVDCTVSRRNEFQISESTYLYNSTDCSIQIRVDQGNLSVSSSNVDVLFKASGSAEEFSLGYDFGDSALVCDVSEGEARSDEARFPVDCSRVDEDISQSWNNESFTDFNVIDRGQDTVGGQAE